MRVAKFSEPGDIDPSELASAVFFDLVEGVDPEELVRFLADRVELPLAEAQTIVGRENARVQERMHWVVEQGEQRERPAAIANRLIEQGWPGPLARGFVERVALELETLAKSSTGREQLMGVERRRMLYGLLWFGGGVFATWITGYSAEHGDGNYQLLAWGPILFGLIQFLHAAFRWCRYKFQDGPTLT
jgi:hypothetical protein